ncbi:MAG: hypothetical protein BZY88_14305 [SAR202 cluster bacterium Io17-Chloro-G9]|nr:MAG: hypothetical protein BZY88_14305 [SAR202 cluster bacterium Io17-Chloro-G9]
MERLGITQIREELVMEPARILWTRRDDQHRPFAMLPKGADERRSGALPQRDLSGRVRITDPLQLLEIERVIIQRRKKTCKGHCLVLLSLRWS